MKALQNGNEWLWAIAYIFIVTLAVILLSAGESIINNLIK